MAFRATKKTTTSADKTPVMTPAMVSLLTEYEHETELAAVGEQEAVTRAFLVNEHLQRLVCEELGLPGLRVLAVARQQAQTCLAEAITIGTVRALTEDERATLRATGVAQKTTAATEATTDDPPADATKAAATRKAKEALGRAKAKAKATAERKGPTTKDAGHRAPGTEAHGAREVVGTQGLAVSNR